MLATKTKTANVLQDVGGEISETKPSSKENEQVTTVTNTFVSETEHLIAHEAGNSIENHPVAEWDGTDGGWPVVRFSTEAECELYLVKYEPDSQWTAYMGQVDHGDLTFEQLVKWADLLQSAARLADRLNTLTTNAVYFQDDALEAYDSAREVAVATDCGLDNCDGTMHDPLAPTAEWWHRVVAETFDESSVMLDVSRDPEGNCSGNISIEMEGDVSAAELRATADTYEAFPAFLRAQADRLDKLNGGE